MQLLLFCLSAAALDAIRELHFCALIFKCQLNLLALLLPCPKESLLFFFLIYTAKSMQVVTVNQAKNVSLNLLVGQLAKERSP